VPEVNSVEISNIFLLLDGSDDAIRILTTIPTTHDYLIDVHNTESMKIA